MLLITWIIKQWFSECHLLFTMEQHLSAFMNKKVTFPRGSCRKAAHLCAVLSPCTNVHALGTAGARTSAPASPVSSPAAGWQQPAPCITPFIWSPAALLLRSVTVSAQPLPASSSILFHFSFRNSFRNKSPCESFTTNTSFPEEVSSRSTRRDCHHQSLLLISYLLLSPVFNYSVQHKMSPGSVLKQNFNPSPVLRYNFHGQQSFSSSERRNEKHRKSLAMKASSSSASTRPPPPRKTFFTQCNPKFLSQSSEDKCFRKAWSTCCRQHTGKENEAPNFK